MQYIHTTITCDCNACEPRMILQYDNSMRRWAVRRVTFSPRWERGVIGHRHPVIGQNSDLISSPSCRHTPTAWCIAVQHMQHTHNSWCTIRLNMHDMRLQMVAWTVCVRASASPSAAASHAVYRCIAPGVRSGVWSSRSPSDIGGGWRPHRPMPRLVCKQAQPTASV